MRRQDSAMESGAWRERAASIDRIAASIPERS
jgi:hypothetical protein